MRIQAVCIALCALVPATASAGNRFDLFYSPLATFGDSEVAAKGDGFGARVQGESGTLLFGFEYSTADYTLIDESVDQLRLGVGMKAGDAASIHGQYLMFDILGTDADGFGAHVQFARQNDEGAGGFFRLGYLSMDADGIGVDGIEYSVGATFPVGTMHGLLEYRASLLEDEDGFELHLEDLHLGISIPFGS